MKVEILKDVNFEHEFGCKGFSSAITGHQVFDTLCWPEAKKGRIWEITEWTSKFLTKDVKECKKVGDSYKFFNTSKEITIAPGKGKIDLFTDTRKEYEKARGGSDPWIHLLLEQSIPMEDRIKLCKFKNLYMELEFEIAKSDKYMSDEDYDPNKHASQVSWYLTVENDACTELDFEGRRDYLWFGLPMFDSRYPTMGGPNTFLDYGTQKLIYSKRRNDYLQEVIEVGKTYKINVDVLPEIVKSFEKTKEMGWLKGASWEDMSIGSMNLGWEIPGTFDVGLKINKISIHGETKED